MQIKMQSTISFLPRLKNETSISLCRLFVIVKIQNVPVVAVLHPTIQLHNTESRINQPSIND